MDSAFFDRLFTLRQVLILTFLVGALGFAVYIVSQMDGE